MQDTICQNLDEHLPSVLEIHANNLHHDKSIYKIDNNKMVTFSFYTGMPVMCSQVTQGLRLYKAKHVQA